MKFECSCTDINGITVSLAVSASQSSFEPCPEASQGILADRDLVSSAFVQSIPQLSEMLVKAHAEAELALQGSYAKLLNIRFNAQEEEA